MPEQLYCEFFIRMKMTANYIDTVHTRYGSVAAMFDYPEFLPNHSREGMADVIHEMHQLCTKLDAEAQEYLRTNPPRENGKAE